MLFPCSSLGSLPQDKVPHKLLQCGSFFKNASRMGHFHGVQSIRNGLLQCESPMGHSYCQKTSSCVGSFLCAAVCDKSLLWHGLSTGCHFVQGTSTCCSVASSMGCRRIAAPPLTSVVCMGTTCVTVIFSAGCRGISAVAPGTSPPPPNSSFLLFLKYVITEVPPASLMGLALGTQMQELALSDTRTASGVFPWKPPLQPPCTPATKTLSNKPDRILKKILHLSSY